MLMEDADKSWTHLFTTRNEVVNFNEDVFNSISNSKTAVIDSIDCVTGDLDEKLNENAMNRIPQDSSKTMGLLTRLKVAEGLPAKICINVSVKDGLTNGAPCIMKYLDYRVKGSDRVSIKWVLFEEELVGKHQRKLYKHLTKPGISIRWTPILEVTRKFSIANNQAYKIIRRQFPIRLCAAKTIHKDQHLTMSFYILVKEKR